MWFILLSLLACTTDPQPDGARRERASQDSQADSSPTTTADSTPTAPVEDQGADVDDDGDGFSEDGSLGTGWPDCDDANADVHPNADEVCDYIDNNCDNSIDDRGGATDWYPDEDSDGCTNQTTWVSVCEGDDSPEGYLPIGMMFDCDDTDPTVCEC